MKDILIGIIVAVSISFSVLICSNQALSKVNQGTISINREIYPDIEWVEYICTDGQWYEITHYTDGTIGIVPIAHSPID
jgi:hypothetical protein